MYGSKFTQANFASHLSSKKLLLRMREPLDELGKESSAVGRENFPSGYKPALRASKIITIVSYDLTEINSLGDDLTSVLRVPL